MSLPLTPPHSLSNLHSQHNGLRLYLQPCVLNPACPENLGTLPVCVQKIGLTYMIGIAESGKGTGIIKPLYSWAVIMKASASIMSFAGSAL